MSCDQPSAYCECSGCVAERAAPPPDTAVRLTARELAEDCARLALNSFGPPRVEEPAWQKAVDAIATHLEASSRSHTDELREAAELVRAWNDCPDDAYDAQARTADALRAWLARHDKGGNVPCSACGGTGSTPRHKRALVDSGICGACGGRGTRYDERTRKGAK